MFLAHTNSLKSGEYLALEQYDKERVLVNSNGYKMVSNICPHQKSIISTGLGRDNRTCPYHGWQFTLDGVPVNSGRTESTCINSKELKKFSVFEWSNLLFDAEVNFDETFNFKDLILVEQRIDIVNSSARNIMDVFLDVDHVPIVHKDVYENIGFETVNDVVWAYHKNGSVQRVQDKALWIAVFPNTMIEWQLDCLFVTVALPLEQHKSKVLVYKYRDKHSSDYEWSYNEKTWEVAWRQDREQAELLLTTNNNNLEPQKLHYKNWLEDNGLTV